ncbi:MAG: hypothetical protein OQJ97_11665 [Rhodospirillales bacterium]|nr:hypothetical protein [Rhodospirillales bacterium]
MRYSRQELARHMQIEGRSAEERRAEEERRLVQGRRQLMERRQGGQSQWNSVDLSLDEQQEVMKRGDCFEPRTLEERRHGEDRRSEYSRRN